MQKIKLVMPKPYEYYLELSAKRQSQNKFRITFTFILTEGKKKLTRETADIVMADIDDEKEVLEYLRTTSLNTAEMIHNYYLHTFTRIYTKKDK